MRKREYLFLKKQLRSCLEEREIKQESDEHEYNWFWGGEKDKCEAKINLLETILMEFSK